jgi:hypothetical protein
MHLCANNLALDAREVEANKLPNPLLCVFLRCFPRLKSHVWIARPAQIAIRGGLSREATTRLLQA